MPVPTSRLGVQHRNPFTLLEYQAARCGQNPAFKFPILHESQPPTEWTDISFSQFAADVNAMARFLTTKFSEKGIPPRSTIAVWFSGFEYAHFVYIFAISRALYTPQVFSDSLTNATIIFELMSKAGAKAIMHDPSFETLIGDCPYVALPTMPISDCHLKLVNAESKSVLPSAEELPSDESVCFIYHTSGSTSGSPKLVPLTHNFLRTIYLKLENTWFQNGLSDTQDVFVQLGSVCHAATMFQFLGLLHFGGCIVRPSSPRFSTTELCSMVQNCGLNHLNLFSALMMAHLDAARKDPAILKMLQKMRTVGYGGLALPPEEEDWGYENNIPFLNIYAATECGILMASSPGQHPALLKPLPFVSCRPELVGETSQIDSPDTKQLYEFVVLSDSPDLPSPHLLSPDGNFRTGDLFEMTNDGHFIFRGRDDDWVKSENAKRCDTKAIEDHVRSTCSNLIKDCIVVGNGRPSPALFLEKYNTGSNVTSEEGLKGEILGRMQQFNDRRYNHERVSDTRLIFILPQGTLPRTPKGNFKRKAIEQLYRKELDGAYASLRA